MDQMIALTAMALDLTAAIDSATRYRRLLEALGRIIPYDAAALLRVENETLIPVAARGLSPGATERRWRRRDQPRLDVICRSRAPVLFPPESRLPDPFEGLVEDRQPGKRIHACLGCPLYVEESLVGVLTADAFDPAAFSGLDPEFLKAVSALAAAQMQTVHLLDALERKAERQGRVASELMRDIRQRHGARLIGRSAAIEHLRREIDIVAQSDFTVLILGETGTGKEVAARAIHARSHRRDAPLLYLNCAALPEPLAESELFGHTRGAFTGANRDRPGKFETADRGTLLLDEIGELPATVQPKLLRAIQEGEIQRVGSDTSLSVDVRLLAATNRNLEEEVRAGRFREDLYHRLNVYPLAVPPLRERREDIPLLAAHFCELIRQRLGTGPVEVGPEVLGLLAGYAWPGNVRELENVLARAILKAAAVTARGEPVRLAASHVSGDLAPSGSAQPAEDPPTAGPAAGLRAQVEDYQRRLIRRAVARSGGNWSAAARELGLHRSNLHHLAARLGIKDKIRGSNLD